MHPPRSPTTASPSSSASARSPIVRQDITAGLEPLALLVEALKRAEQDSGAKLLGEIRSLDIVNFLSWRYRDPDKQLSRAPRHRAGARLLRSGRRRKPDPLSARGRRSASRAANAASPRSAAPKRSRPRPRPSAPASPCRGRRSRMMSPEPKRGAAFQKPIAVKLGVFRPVTVYPLYEAATAAHWGQTPREAMAESGELWSTYSDVAAQNPNAWLKRRFASERDHHADAGQPADRLALHQTDGGQSDRQYGRRRS